MVGLFNALAVLDRECILGAKDEQFKASSIWELERMKKMMHT